MQFLHHPSVVIDILTISRGILIHENFRIHITFADTQGTIREEFIREKSVYGKIFA